MLIRKNAGCWAASIRVNTVFEFYFIKFDWIFLYVFPLTQVTVIEKMLNIFFSIFLGIFPYSINKCEHISPEAFVVSIGGNFYIICDFQKSVAAKI